MIIYGIKTCSTVGKARKFMNDRGIDFIFFDYKVDAVTEDKIREWLIYVDIDTIFNNKGKKYRDLNLKDLNLDLDGKIKWLAKENLLLKRPIIEHNNKVYVGYDEALYNEVFK